MNEYAYDEAAMENIDIDYPEDVDVDEDFDFEAPEAIEYDEDYDFGELAEARRPSRASARSRALAQARARAQAQARMKAMQRPRPTPPPRPYFPATARQPATTDKVRQGFSRVGTDVSKIKSGLQTIDLNRRVQADLISRTLKSQSERITGNEYALATSKIADQVIAQFPGLVSNSIIRTALPLAPLFFLKPQKRGTGFGAVVSDPRFWGAGAAFALLGLKEILDRNPAASTGASAVTTGASSTVAPPGQSPNGTLLQKDLNTLAALLGTLTKQVETLAQAAQTAQAAPPAQAAPAAASPAQSQMVQMMQAALAAQSPEVINAWLKSLETQQKAYSQDVAQSAPQEQTSQTKSKASAAKSE